MSWMPQVGLKFIAAFECVMFKVFVSDFLLLFSDFIKNISSDVLAEICKYFRAEKSAFHRFIVEEFAEFNENYAGILFILTFRSFRFEYKMKL